MTAIAPWSTDCSCCRMVLTSWTWAANRHGRAPRFSHPRKPLIRRPLPSGDHIQTSQPVSEKEELERVIPVIAALKHKRPEAVISVDTYKANVARAAVEAGAEIVNDVSGFRWDPQMVKTLAGLKCGAVLMHMRGRPSEWRTLPPVSDVVTLVKRELRERADAALLGGVKRERIVLDPGFGFGKSFQENYPLLKRFEELHELRYPLLAGVSRKSFIGRALARNGNDAPVGDRIYGTLATETALILKGAAYCSHSRCPSLRRRSADGGCGGALEEPLSAAIIKNCAHEQEASSTFDHRALCPA